MKDQIRLAVLGCGAITREAHLPAVVAHPGVRLAALVDVDLKRAEILRQAYRLDCRVTNHHGAIFSEVDAVINALPNHLHAPITLEAMRSGIHVLCEKPLATNAADAQACCEVAVQKGVLLAAGMNRRFHANNLILKLMLNEGLLGSLQSYEWEYGAPWDWGTASGFYLSPSQSGGGVLIDFGVHMLDGVVNWFGPVTHLEYLDDNWGGGVEANAVLCLEQAGRYGKITGHLRMSRIHNLKNRLVVRGTNARAEIKDDPDVVLLYRTIAGRDMSMTLRFADRQKAREDNSFYQQLDNFVESIKGTQSLVADCRQAQQVVELIERCYSQARRIPEPWSEVSAPTRVQATA